MRGSWGIPSTLAGSLQGVDCVEWVHALDRLNGEKVGPAVQLPLMMQCSGSCCVGQINSQSVPCVRYSRICRNVSEGGLGTHEPQVEVLVQHAGLKYSLIWTIECLTRKRLYRTKAVGKHEVTASCPPTCSVCRYVSIMIPLCNYQSLLHAGWSWLVLKPGEAEPQVLYPFAVAISVNP